MSAISLSGSVASLTRSRDAEGGFLPPMPCPNCGTRLIGLVLQATHSRGKKFYKCPKLEHTNMACKFYMFEEAYVDYLVQIGILEGGCVKEMAADLKVTGMVEEAMDEVQHCSTQLKMAVSAMKEAEGVLKVAADREMVMGSKIDRIGDRFVVVGLANIILVALVLMVLLVK